MRLRAMLAVGGVLLTLPSAGQEIGWQADAIARALEFHADNLPELCVPPQESAMVPASFELQIGEETAARQALLVEFPCQIGAYSETAVYLLSDQLGQISEVFFPSPQFEVAYSGEGESARVEEIAITETLNRREVINPSYDADSRTITERNKWRELGDAYATTRWGFKDGRFQIMYFAVDATFDGKDNPQILIDEDIW